MSDIDLVPHFRVGLFATLPLYMAREDGCWLGRSGTPEPSTVMRKGDLALGGGSGEHEALVIHDPAHCVARFLHDFGLEHTSAQSFPSAIDPSKFTFCNDVPEQEWIEEFSPFYLPWSDSLSFLNWAAIEVGQFVYHRLPDFYEAVAQWRGRYGDVEVQATICSIPWDRYRGSGSDLFHVSARVEAPAER